MAINFFLLLLISFAWASDYIFIKWADEALPPITVGAGMATMAAIMLVIVVRGLLRRPLMPTLRSAPLVPLVLGATAVAWPRITVVYAETDISPDTASLTGTTVPILTMLVTVFITKQVAYSHLRMMGVLVAVIGLYVFVSFDSTGEGSSTLVGMLIMMSGGVTFVFSGIYTSLKAAELDKMVMTVWVMAAGAVMLAVPALIFEGGQLEMPSALALGSIAASGLVPMAMAYLLYFVVIDRAGPAFASMFAYLIPPLAMGIGVIFLGHSLTVSHIAGLVLVLIGLWMITHQDKQPHPAMAVGEAAS